METCPWDVLGRVLGMSWDEGDNRQNYHVSRSQTLKDTDPHFQGLPKSPDEKSLLNEIHFILAETPNTFHLPHGNICFTREMNIIS